MTDRFKGFLITLDKEIREDDAESIINALKMVKGVFQVKSYVSGAEDWMMYEKGVWDTRIKMMDHLNKKVESPKE
jgi:hypothetical protein